MTDADHSSSDPSALDVLLYDWLAAPDRTRAEAKFRAYYAVAFRIICRSVLRCCNEADAKDIFQEAIIKFSRKVHSERTGAAESLSEALERLSPLDFGDLHGRLVQDWSHDIAVFRDAAVSFRIQVFPGHDPESVSLTQWREQRNAIDGRVEPLARRGNQFLRDVKDRTEPKLQALMITKGSATERPLDEFVNTLLELAQARGIKEFESELGCAGSISFVQAIHTIIARLPALKIPVNGLLFEIVKNGLVDLLRKNQARNRREVSVQWEGESTSLLEDIFGEEGPEISTERNEEVAPAESGPWLEMDESSCIDLYRDFLQFLRLPLTEAELAHARKPHKGRWVRETEKLELLRSKYTQLIDVLTAFGRNPGTSQDDTGSKLGLTRNQVRYAMKRLGEEFDRFCRIRFGLNGADAANRSQFVKGAVAHQAIAPDDNSDP